jgi:hypothetical protein
VLLINHPDIKNKLSKRLKPYRKLFTDAAFSHH